MMERGKAREDREHRIVTRHSNAGQDECCGLSLGGLMDDVVAEGSLVCLHY